VTVIDFTEIYAAVINDVSFRIILIGMMICNLKAKTIDIETAFLHGDLEGRIFMGIPSGMKVGIGKFLVLKKTSYGLVHSSTQFYIKLVRALKSCRFTGSLVDPCLWVEKSNEGIDMTEI
jgi:hypothetical protein